MPICPRTPGVKIRTKRTFWAATIIQDIRFTLRTARKNPGFVLTATCTLALGIGANTAIFSLISGVLLRPLPFSHPGDLVQLNEINQRDGVGPVSYPDLEVWRKQSRSFDGMSAYGTVSKNLQGIENPERIAAVWAERGLFRLLGVQPIAGRTFRDDDPSNVVVIGSGFWKRRFASDPSCIGRKITLDGEPYTVIGVMGETFQFPYNASFSEIWIPWSVPQQWEHDRNYHVNFVVARLKRGVRVNAALSELGVISERIAAQYPDRNNGNRPLSTPLSEVVTGRVRPALLTLLGAVGVLLLIACANLVNLLLGRAASRTHEIAVRAALGASRGRLIQQLLTESVLMSAAGGAAGLLVALFSMDPLLKFASSRIPRAWEIGFDWRVFLFLLVVVFATGIVFGLVPALSMSRPDVQRGLSAAGGSRVAGYGSSGWSGRRLRDSLVVAEIALAFVLVVATGLLLRAFLHLQSTPTGFAPDNVLTLHMTVSLREYGDRGAYGRYLHAIEERLDQIPGVRTAGFIQFLPLQNWGWMGGFSIAGRPPKTDSAEPMAELRYVSPGYFTALGVPIHRGRGFTDHDASDTPAVILINESLAHRYFPNQDPIGQRTDRGTIIGVVGDVRQSGLDRPATPEIYYSFAQNAAATSDAGVSLVIRAGMRPEALVATVRDAVHQVNPNQVLFNIETMSRVIAESFAGANLYLWLVGLFSAIAVLLAIAGTYGVLSYAVTGRTHEFAIRLALGANRRQILNIVLAHGSMLIAIGLAVGAAGALTVTRALETLVESVTSPDAVTLAAVGTLLTVVALAACLAPAYRATRVDPNTALKSD